MVTALQITGNTDSIRQEAVTKLQEIANEYGLSYTLDETYIRIALPKYDEVELPVVGTVEVDTTNE